MIITMYAPGHSPASGVVTAWFALSPAPLEVNTTYIFSLKLDIIRMFTMITMFMISS